MKWLLFAIAFVAFAAIGAQIGPGLMGPGPGMTGAPPATLPGSITAWYSADCITFVSSVCGTPSNGSTITAWADRSGNGHNLTLASGTATFNTSQINGLPAVTFSSAKWNMASSIAPNTGNTVWAVFNANSGLAKGVLFGGAFGAFTYWLTTTPTSGQAIDSSSCVGGTHTGTNTTMTSGAWHQSSIQWVLNTSGAFRLDKTADGSFISATGAPTALSTVGYNGCNATEFFAGQVAELGYYNNSGTAIGDVESYNASKYGL